VELGEEARSGVPFDQHRVVEAATLGLVGVQGEHEPDRTMEPSAQGPEQVAEGYAEVDVPFRITKVVLGEVMREGERDVDNPFDAEPADDAHGIVLIPAKPQPAPRSPLALGIRVC
jgi:hypothetical protein